MKRTNLAEMGVIMIGLGTSCCFNHHSNKQICTLALVPGGGCWKSPFLALLCYKKMLLGSFFSKQNCHFQMYLRIQSLYRDIRLMSGDHLLRGLRAWIYGSWSTARYRARTKAWTGLNKENKDLMIEVLYKTHFLLSLSPKFSACSCL